VGNPSIYCLKLTIPHTEKGCRPTNHNFLTPEYPLSPIVSQIANLAHFNINDLQLACFMYSATHGLLPFYFINVFEVNSCIHTHDTRQKDKIHQIGHKLNLRKFTVTNAGPLLWNALPAYLCVFLTRGRTDHFSTKQSTNSHLQQHRSVARVPPLHHAKIGTVSLPPAFSRTTS